MWLVRAKQFSTQNAPAKFIARVTNVAAGNHVNTGLTRLAGPSLREFASRYGSLKFIPKSCTTKIFPRAQNP
jgi:hypothetical protein